jgi:DNA-binding MarR family transcriptional regulator
MDRALLNKCTCFAVRCTARALTQMYDAALAPAGIRSTQYMVLAAIGERTDVSVNELADTMVMDRTTLGRNLRLLERDGLVTLSTPEEDRRRRDIALTRKGKALLDGAYPLWRHAHDSLQKTHGREFLEQFRGMLKQVSPGIQS